MSRPGPAPSRRGSSGRTAAQPRTPGAARLPVVNETSAGGLVCRTVDGVVEGALIGRLDRHGVMRWLLPKGHLEGAETAAEAAVREVAEETGIIGHIVAEIGTLDYWFTTADRRVHKTVHHFVLAADGGELSLEDVEVDEVGWLPLDEVLTRLSYEDERRLAALVPGLLGSEA